MKRTWTTKLMAMGAAGLLGSGATAAATDLFPDEDQDRAREMILLKTADGDGQSIAVRIENGEVTATLNGQAIDSDRVEHKDGRVVILDEDGNEIEQIVIGMAGDRGFAIADGEGFARFGQGMWVMDPDGENPFGTISLTAEVDPPPVMIGIAMSQPGPALIKHLRLEPGQSTMISGVYEGLPAHDAGLEPYDIIVEIEGRAPADAAAMREALKDKEDGDRLRLTVISEGEKRTVRLTLDAYDAETMREATFFGGARTGGTGSIFIPRGGQNMPDIDIRAERFFDQEDMERIQKQIQERITRVRPKLSEVQEEQLDDRLIQLDDRMAEMERMLDRLLDRIEQTRRDDR